MFPFPGINGKIKENINTVCPLILLSNLLVKYHLYVDVNTEYLNILLNYLLLLYGG